MLWLARIVIGLVIVVVIVAAFVAIASSVQLNKTIDVPESELALTIPTDADSIARGRHFVTAINGCIDCHGANLSGSIFLDVPPFRVVAPNLTRGQGGIAASFTDEDFVLAIRHGLDPEHHRLFIMPSDTYTWLSDRDLADVIAYVKSAPPVDHVLPDTEFTPLGRALLAFGQFPPFPADIIDHNAMHPAAEPAAATVAYGQYLAHAAGCLDCHGAGLSGGAIPGMPPDTPHSQNITPTGIGTWSEPDFVHAIRTGTRPDGTSINPLMPWRDYALMSDTELAALYKYLRQVPPRASGTL
jgi:mono/diheme cytochrome c family protein